MGRPRGSKNKPRTLRPPLEATSLNSMASVEIPAGEPIGNNHILRQVRRPVGRPKGLKNKPKTSPPLTKISSEIVIDIPEGSNIVQWLLDFCRRRQVSVTVLNASGQLANIIPYFQPNFNIPSPLPILSLSGTVVPTPPPLSGAITSQETIYFPLCCFSSLVGRCCMRRHTGEECDGGKHGERGCDDDQRCTMTLRQFPTIKLTPVTYIETPPVSDVPPETQNPLFDYFDGLIVEDRIELCDQTNIGNIETTPASDVPPQTQNLSFDDIHRMVVEDRIELYDEFHRPVTWDII